MNDLLASWCDLMLLGSLQNLPLLLLALVLDRVFVMLAMSAPRRVIWLLVVVELLLPPFVGAPLHVAGSVPLLVPLAATVRADLPLYWFFGWLVIGSLLALRSSLRLRRSSRRMLDLAEPVGEEVGQLACTVACELGLKAVPGVFVSNAARGPCVLGVLRPVVVLDRETAAGHAQQSRDAMRHTLLHEFAHLRRRDPLRAWLWRWLLAGFWFHPSAWVALRRFALLREIGCDALVTRHLGKRGPYCATLTRKLLGSEQGLVSSTAFVRLPAEVLQRVAALQNSGRHAFRHVGAAVVAAFALLFCCVPLRESAPLPFGVATLDDMPGCLHRRYFVLSQLPTANPSPSLNLTASPESR